MRLANIIVPVLVAISVLLLFSCQKGLAYTLEESFQKTLLQEGATKLSVSNRNGNIVISPWQEDSIRIEATKKIKAANKKKAREYAEELKIEISREGNEIIIRTIRPDLEERRGFGAIFRISKREIQTKVAYNIRVPEKLDLNLRSRNGSIKTGGIQGDVTGETRNGGIQIDDVEGKVFARSRNGDISLAEIDGSVEVETRNGKISLSEIIGSVETVTRNGNIRVDQADEDVSAHSRNGSISLLKIGGSVNASTRNGKIWTEITGKSFQGCDLSTRNATITLIVPGSLSADLDVYTRNGKVNTELPVAVFGTFSRGELKGKINQGGPLLRLRTRNGNIAIRKSKEVTKQ